MAAHLTDKRKKKIVADYLEMQSINAVATKNKVSWSTVRSVLDQMGNIEEKLEQKKEKNTADILAHMDEKKDLVNQIIDKYLEALLEPEKIAKANPAQLTTALGTVIDKFTMARNERADADEEDDPLTKALKEEAERMQNETD